VIDLRTALDLTSAPVRIPGAQMVSPEDLDAHQLPRGSEIVLYCTEPHEATSVRAAADLAAAALTRVHVLAGGLDGWRRRGFPVEALP
jgi:rhodanese-related sulfurtransferase